jgi:oligopeptide transport system substrate-binding protein
MYQKITLYLALVFTLLFFSCGRNSRNENDNVFRYNEMGDVTSLDPAEARNFENLWVDNQLYNGLVQTGDSFSVKPCIASKWEISTDGLTYTFHLRNDVFFQDNEVFPSGKGRKVVAYDFVFSFYRLLDPRVSDATSLLEKIKDFVAPDDSTFVIHLKTPYAPFLHILLMKYFSVVPEEAIKKYGIDFGENPVGTGPFYLKRWEHGNALVLKRNPNYFEKDSAGNALPYLNGVIISFLKDEETSFLEFMDGKFDMVSGISAINPRVAFTPDGQLRKEFTDKVYILRTPFIKTDYLGFILDSKAFNSHLNIHNSRLLRQAISYAINRDEIVRYLRYNTGIPAANGFIPPFLPGHGKVTGYSYNPDKATGLLKQAGYPNGQGLPEISLFVSSQDYELAEAIQAQLQNVGIKLKVETEQPAILAEGVANGQCYFFKKSWIGDYPDAENFLSLFYSKNFSPGDINYTHFANPAFDSLYERSLSETSDSIRAAEYTMMDNMIMDAAPVVPLYYDEVIRLVNKNVTGLPLDPLNSLDLRRVKKQRYLPVRSLWRRREL